MGKNMKIIIVKNSHASFFSSFPLFRVSRGILHLPYNKKITVVMEYFLGILGKYLKLDIVNLMPQYGYYPPNCAIMTVFWDSITKKYPSASTKHLNKIIEENLNKSDGIIVWFDENQRDLKEFYPGLEKKAVRLPFGVDLGGSFDEQPVEHGCNNDFDLMYVATNQPRKRLGEFLKISTLLYEANLISQICLVTNSGGVRYIEKDFPFLKDLITVKSGVSEEELKSLYKRSKLFLNTSVYEGLGLPNLEAIYLGTPVLCSDISIFRAVLGVAGRYLSPEISDTETNYEIVKGMLELDGSTRKKVWMEQQKAVARLLDFNKCYNAIIEL